MQLGTRWAVGENPPANLPEVVTYAVSTVEEELTATTSRRRAGAGR
jgi:hypothetical protein